MGRDSNEPSMARAMGIPDIVSLVAIELEVKDLASVSCVCLCYSGIARRELRFRVYHVLKRYVSAWHIGLGCNLSFPIVDRIIAFLRMLHEHRTVVAGLTALAVLLSHSTYIGQWITDVDMDIVTPKGEGAAVVVYLTEVEGYEVQSMIAPSGPVRRMLYDQHLDYWRRRNTVSSATVLIRRSDRRRIYIVESVTKSALSPVSQVTNSLTCNWLDLHGISSAYPRNTTRGYGTHNPSFKLDDIFMTRQNILLPLNGFIIEDFKHDTNHCRKVHSYCPRRRRISEDGLTFRMALWSYNEHDRDSQLDHHRTVTHLPRVMWIWGDWDNHASHGQPYVPSKYAALEPMYEGQVGHP